MDINERIYKLIMGNVSDKVALKNICEAQGMDMDELSEEDREFLYHTNHFYCDSEDFCKLHEEEEEFFHSLVEDGYIVKTEDGYVYKNCV